MQRLLLSSGLVLQQPAAGAACAPELIKSYGRMANKICCKAEDNTRLYQSGPTWPSLSWKQWEYRREWLKPKGDNSSKENLKYAFCSPLRYCMCLQGGVSQSYMWYFFLDSLHCTSSTGQYPTTAFVIFWMIQILDEIPITTANSLERPGASQFSRSPSKSREKRLEYRRRGSKQVYRTTFEIWNILVEYQGIKCVRTRPPGKL